MNESGLIEPPQESGGVSEIIHEIVLTAGGT